MDGRAAVEFAPDVEARLPRDLLERLAAELWDVFERASPAQFPPERIHVSRCFSGYSPKPAEKLVFGVEVKYESRYATHILKIGSVEEVGADHGGWQKCTAGREVSSRIFVPITFVSNVNGDRGRVAVLYRDAYRLYGPNPSEGQPRMLEQVVQSAVEGCSPDCLSVQRVIAQIYTDLGIWFFPGACDNAEAAEDFYRQKLHASGCGEAPVLQRWREEADRQDLRRDAIWVLCGCDRPDADPRSDPARYLDPVDFVAWSLAVKDGSRLPATLVGRAHGDLHGRNVLLGVRRNEAEYPAVFDYGEMGDVNVLAWDFVKLEMEIRVRTLPFLLRDAEVRRRLWQEARYEPPEKAPALSSADSMAVERAGRLRAFLAFEQLLDALTRRILACSDAEPIETLPCCHQTKAAKLDRLLCLLLRIRKEGSLWLGFKHHQRQKVWRAEYYFAMAVYGLLNIRWDYEPPQYECALVAAGAAAAMSPSTPEMLKEAIDAGSAANHEYPSYRVPLAIAHQHWKQREYARGCKFLEEFVLDVSDPKTLEARPEMRHAVPLIAEAALLEMEVGPSSAAEPLLKPLRPLARQFGDYEMLGRIGRLFKDSGDDRWKREAVSGANLPAAVAVQMYRAAFEAYHEAFQATRDYYTGINAATLALLIGEREISRQLAQEVAGVCGEIKVTERGDRYWLFATEGEAQLLLLSWDRAISFYGDAIQELHPTDYGMADSTYKQLRRLRKAMPDHEQEIRPILKLFENHPEFGGHLSTDLFP